MRVETLRAECAGCHGPLLIAVTHLSHLDPVLLGIVARGRPIDWLARDEFYKYRPVAALLRGLRAIRVRRFGVSASAVRESLRRLRDGRVVGICPEGGVCRGEQSVLRGGDLKRGVCLISARSGVPVLPAIVLADRNLNTVSPWLPFRRIRLYVAFAGQLIHPPPLPAKASRAQRKAGRDAMAAELARAYQDLFRETLHAFNLPDGFAL